MVVAVMLVAGMMLGMSLIDDECAVGVVEAEGVDHGGTMCRS